VSHDRTLFGEYPTASAFEAEWRSLARRAGGHEGVVGSSVEGRPLRHYRLGRGGMRVLVTGLMHGVEMIGAMAAQALVRRLASDGPRAERVLDAITLDVVPVVNPDAFELNLARLGAGGRAGQRGNARGVDLNRNFPVVRGASSWHPFSGSRLPFSPHYAGPSALSEPESRALVELASQVKPHVSLAFHSFGNMLLFPYAHSFARHPEARAYEAMGAAMNAEMAGPRYQVKPSAQLYPVIGDFDDWLDAEFGTMAMTVEVSTLDRRLLHPKRLFNPFSWMNPTRVEETTGALVPGLLALLEQAAGITTAPVRLAPPASRPSLDLVAARR
jgi:predicted deacylase